MAECKKTARLSTDEAIERFRAVHGDRYDYSRVEYVSNSTKVTIGCAIHGFFEQIPGDHWRGIGCTKCAGDLRGRVRKERSRDAILAEFIKVHGDRYDYSLVEYVDSKTKVSIICREHGVFEQAPAMHKLGNGCPACAQIARTAGMVVGYDVWIQRFKDVHGDTYDYSRVERGIRASKKIEILCRTHGAFKQKPPNHAAGEGCPKCAVNYPDTQDSVIRKFIQAHGDRYDYSNVKYVDSGTKVTIVCAKHGEFQQSPEGHVAGRGCWHCGVEQRFDVSSVSRSAPELELHGFVESLGFAPMHGYLPDSDNKFTYDIILPERGLAIEFNGTYWHSYPRAHRAQHMFKRKNAESFGFRLITIWEDDWKLKRDRIEAHIKRCLLGPDIKIGARQTYLLRPTVAEAKAFHEAYHIQSFRNTNAREHYALALGGEIVAVASFSDSFVGTLHRYTVKSGLSIAGGLSKIVKAYIKDYSCIELVTFCDRDYFTGDVYDASGFRYDGTSTMLTYNVRGVRVRRENYMKAKLPELFGEVDMSKREIDIAADNGVFACWNSGVDRYVWRGGYARPC